MKLLVFVWSTKTQKHMSEVGSSNFDQRAQNQMNGDEFVNHIITGAETWISHNTPKTN